MIPETKQAAVARALNEAFGVKDVEDIRPLTAGLSSALVFRIVVHSRPCADRKIAPRVLYTNIEDRLWITDFVEARPFSAQEALFHLPGTLRRLHSLPPFPNTGN